MNNVFAQSVTDDDFYPRTKIINRIYRYLDGGNHLLIAAPRRVGKTSIMLHLRDKPRGIYQFIYVFLEPINSIEKYYEKLIEALFRSDALSALTKKSSKFKELAENTIGRIKGIDLAGWFGFELHEKQNLPYQKGFEQLMDKLDTKDHRIVFLLDEYPQAVENIKSKHGVEIAKEFLQQCRGHRHSGKKNLLYVYTGSIGLPSVVKGITSSNVVNDIGTVEVGPLSMIEAKEMTNQILNNNKIAIELAAIDALLESFDWLIPFHIQLAIKEVIEIYEEENRQITVADIKDVNAKILDIRNNMYFEQYHARLRRAYKKSTYKLVIELLNYVAENQPVLSVDIYKKFDKKMKNSDYNRIIESLQFDGYILFDNDTNKFQFTSKLIRTWWVKFIIKN